MRNRSGSGGFTLVELLVVIAIIGILVALLLPAVQAAREAGRRSSCLNNLKQISLGLHNHHDIVKRLPPGCAADQPPFGTAASNWGSSWKVYLLPYIEQGPIHDKWQFNTSSGYTNANNIGLVNQLTIGVYRCPSTTLPDMSPYSNTSGFLTMFTCYQGNAGSANSAHQPLNAGNGHGPSAATGPLFANSKATLAHLTDGTSNTILVGEQSDHQRNLAGQPIIGGFGAITSQGPHGWHMGASDSSVGQNNGERHFNCVSTRWEINRRGLDGSSANGAHDNTGNNIPFNSNHAGGCCMALGDASTRYVSQTIPLLTLQQLAAGNDGSAAQFE